MPAVRFLPFALAATLLAAPAFAQTPVGDALRGKALFDNPAQASGNNGLPTCASCHGSVEARRATISQNTGGAYDPYANIEFETAMTRLVAALQGQQAMAAFRVLTAQQVADIAAYLADTPKTNPVSETQLNFTTANNSFSPAQPITLTHARATSENLVVTNVAVVGAGASQFVIGAVAGAALCNGTTLQPAGSCALTVTYSPTTNAAASADLVLTMRQGPTTNPTFERALPLRGQIASAGGGGSTDSGGGGALGLGWLLALGAAVAALSRRRG